MAGTTRLELATSAVTGCVNRFYNNLQDTRGLPNTVLVVQDIAFCGLSCGLETIPTAPNCRCFMDGVPITVRDQETRVHFWSIFLVKQNAPPQWELTTVGICSGTHSPTLPAENDEDVKKAQSLMRHANSNITMNGCATRFNRRKDRRRTHRPSRNRCGFG
jgi:hypothetical protein